MQIFPGPKSRIRQEPPVFPKAHSPLITVIPFTFIFTWILERQAMLKGAKTEDHRIARVAFGDFF